ncbi:hypothetical protein B0I37DRAFT_404997 [Chaetomium sp. MPI-CAGE-AT-0009]|nr:hypothetical protein B0I37DRAFT_404997 [Chaetomium sp. MPI-CAGE-AT-0009]
MFIYTGKLQWQGEAVDELLVVVLPNGPVRVGDPIWTLSQWTRDSKGNKKVLWNQQQFIEKVTRADSGDDTFHFGAGWYKYNVEAHNVYQTKKEWADNEPIVVIVPEGFGTDKPLLAFWQWKEDLNKDFRANYINQTTQQAEAPSEGSLTFNSLSTDRYTLTCTWDEKTEKLATRVTGPDHEEDTMLDLTALIRFHSDEVTPPEFPGEKVELEVHYPRAEAALPRIQSPLPFPPTLLETLAHTASFLDRAGYLAKYAVDRCHALDKSYHALQQQIDDLNGQTQDLSGQVVSPTGENDEDKKQIDSLQKQLAQALDEAAQREAELTKQVQDLQATLAKEQTHDTEDHKALDDAHEQIRKDQEAQAIFKKQVTVLQFQLSETDRRNRQLQAKVNEQAQQASDLQGQLAAEKAHNAELQTQASESKAKVAVLETETSAVKRTLVRTAEDLKQAQADSNDKDSIIDGLENGIVAVKKDRDAKKAAYEHFKLVTDANIKELNNKIDQLTAQLKA